MVLNYFENFFARKCIRDEVNISLGKACRIKGYVWSREER
jgi:hypothetical protein